MRHNLTFCLFVLGLFFLSLYTSVSKQFSGAGTTTVPLGIKTEGRKPTLLRAAVA